MKMRKFFLFFQFAFLAVLAFLTSIVSGCFDDQLNSYKNQTPKLNFREIFDGQVIGYGTIQDYKSKVIRRFKVTMDCSWKGNQGHIIEKFFWDDNSKSERQWDLIAESEDTIRGKASDAIGDVVGHSAGSAMNFKYSLKVPIDNKEMILSFNDWMYLIQPGVIINRNKMLKFGIPVGDITIFLYKEGMLK
jgi:hypothetical protein